MESIIMIITMVKMIIIILTMILTMVMFRAEPIIRYSAIYSVLGRHKPADTEY